MRDLAGEIRGLLQARSRLARATVQVDKVSLAGLEASWPRTSDTSLLCFLQLVQFPLKTKLNLVADDQDPADSAGGFGLSKVFSLPSLSSLSGKLNCASAGLPPRDAVLLWDSTITLFMGEEL